MNRSGRDSKVDLGGWCYALGAFGWWGFVFPIVLIGLNASAKERVDSQVTWSLEILAHRVIWSLIVCVGLIHVRQLWPKVGEVLRSRRALRTLLLTALLLAGNWFGFTVGASIGRLSEASLGYYINPLLNVLLGAVFLKERLRRPQAVAVGFAALGVAWMVLVYGEIPWIAFIVAGNFALYGLLRKRLHVDAVTGLAFETAFCLPVAISYLVYREIAGPATVLSDGSLAINALLVACGPATAAPLIWFAAAARRLPLSTIGFIQFVAPTGQLLLALTLNGESLSTMRAVGFLLIWIGVAIYVWDTWNVRVKK